MGFLGLVNSNMLSADDLILVSVSVNLLQRMIDTCCEEAAYLDMSLIYTVNHKKREILFLTITLANLSRFL